MDVIAVKPKRTTMGSTKGFYPMLVRLDPEVHQLLKLNAAQEHTSINALINDKLRDAVTRPDRSQKPGDVRL